MSDRLACAQLESKWRKGAFTRYGYPSDQIFFRRGEVDEMEPVVGLVRGPFGIYRRGVTHLPSGKCAGYGATLKESKLLVIRLLSLSVDWWSGKFGADLEFTNEQKKAYFKIRHGN